MCSGGAAFDGRMDFLTIAANRLTCSDTLSAIRTTVLSIQPVVVDGVSVLCDTARGMIRPLVPQDDRRQAHRHPRPSTPRDQGFVRGGRGLSSGEADEGGVRVREARRRGAALGTPVPRAV